MRTYAFLSVLLFVCAVAPQGWCEEGKTQVVVSNAAYRSIAEYIGGDKVQVEQVVAGNQDPHIVRPKPSLALLLKDADLFIGTGLDLEMWSPALVDMSGNPDIRSGQKGFVAASAGMPLMEIPANVSRSEGDVHVYGNPHIHTSPLNCKVIAENIYLGLRRIAPSHEGLFKANLKRFKDEIDRRMFGNELVRLLGSKTLTKLARTGKLVPFLERKKYKGQPLIRLLDGWMKEALPLRGRKIVCYHKTIVYFASVMGIDIVGYLEPKPGIPPSPGHLLSVMNTMKAEDIRVLWAENYFDVGKVAKVAKKVGAVPVVVWLAPGQQEGMKDVFDMFDVWIRELNAAFAKADRAGR